MLHKSISSTKVRTKKKDTIDQTILIGMLGVNCLEYTRRTLDTIKSGCKEVHVLYIDNGSTPENVEQLKAWPKGNPDITTFTKHFNGRNAGVGPGWNQIIKAGLAKGVDKILVCNNDIVFGEHTINGMVQAYDQLRKHVPETVMVTATNHTKNPAELDKIKQVWKYHPHPDFSCYMITKETIDRVGLLPSEYMPAFFEDNDYHWRILAMGYHAWGSDWAPYSHIASRTRHGNPNLVTHLEFRQNKVKFFKKWFTNTCDQEVIVARRKQWLAAYPETPHPTEEQILSYIDQRLVTDELRRWLEELNIDNVPN